MIESLDPLLFRLEALRDGFDRSFAAEACETTDAGEDLLAISLGGDPYALRVREVHGIYVDLAVTTLPLAVPELVGLAAIRGELVAVYDLAVLLGYERPETPRYLVQSSIPSLGFAFGQLTGHRRVSRQQVTPRATDAGGWLREVVQEEQMSRPIVELAAVCARIEQQLGSESDRENSSNGS